MPSRFSQPPMHSISNLAYSFRQATADDYDFLYQLHASTIKPYVEVIWGWHEEWQQEYFRAKFDPRNRQIIQVEGEDVGVLVLERKENEIFIALLEIKPSYQGRGIGTAIVRQIIEEGQSQNLPIILHVLRSNIRARYLYERLGFAVNEEQKFRYQMIYPAPFKDN